MALHQLFLQVVAVKAEFERVRDYRGRGESSREPGDIGDQVFKLGELARNDLYLYICFQVGFKHVLSESFTKDLHFRDQVSPCEKVKDLFEEVPRLEDSLETLTT
jgi:hypothetical protein